MIHSSCFKEVVNSLSDKKSIFMLHAFTVSGTNKNFNLFIIIYMTIFFSNSVSKFLKFQRGNIMTDIQKVILFNPFLFHEKDYS